MTNDFNKLYDHINNNTPDIKEHIRFLLKKAMRDAITGANMMSHADIITYQTEAIYEFIKDKIK